MIDRKLAINEIAILGSCVSRDAVEFIADLPVVLYCARQAIASAVSRPPAKDLIAGLALNPGIHPFHRRCIEEDVNKTSLSQLASLPFEVPIIIDLIEERVPLGRMADGSVVTLSEAATLLSNLRELVIEEIEPWSPSHLELFRSALPDLAKALEGHTVLIHRALYADTKRSFPEVNTPLATMYDELLKSLPHALVLEAPADVLRHELRHKWKAGPYHYIDAYYHEIVRQLGRGLAVPLSVKPNHSLRLPEPNCF